MKQRPFEKLKDLALTARQARQPREDRTEPSLLKIPDTAEMDDDTLFDWAMRDVIPLPGNRTALKPVPRSRSSPARNDDAEVLDQLHSLVNGETAIDPTLLDEYIERAVTPGARPLLRKLRRGQYAVQAVLDLHGMDRDEARRRVEAFVLQSAVLRFGCVKIIHGRGHNSKENRAILKELLQLWLATRRMSRHVVAYTSARPCDGGAGAVYVLLKKARARRKTSS